MFTLERTLLAPGWHEVGAGCLDQWRNPLDRSWRTQVDDRVVMMWIHGSAVGFILDVIFRMGLPAKCL